MKTVNIYTDGACRGNPGKGGWGALIEYGDSKKEYYGGEIVMLLMFYALAGL